MYTQSVMQNRKDTNPTRPTAMHEQILTLGKQAARLRDALTQKKTRDLPNHTIDDLDNLDIRLTQLGRQMEDFEAEHANLLALANIRPRVNSSLELDAVLRIVMDNIVRLTRAERGFLMLRDEQG